MELDFRSYQLSQERLRVEQEVLALADPNVGLHGISTFRDGLIDIAKHYYPQQTPEGDDSRFTYYAPIDPARMRQHVVHPLFFTHTILWARTFAQRAVKRLGKRCLITSSLTGYD